MAKIIRKTNEQIIKQTAKDMLRKNLINDQSKMFLKDPNMIKQAIKAYDTELIKEYLEININIADKDSENGVNPFISQNMIVRFLTVPTEPDFFVVS